MGLSLNFKYSTKLQQSAYWNVGEVVEDIMVSFAQQVSSIASINTCIAKLEEQNYKEELCINNPIQRCWSMLSINGLKVSCFSKNVMYLIRLQS